jgi:tripartite-type tricarboxylate transporter receptor subunit TctC
MIGLACHSLSAGPNPDPTVKAQFANVGSVPTAMTPAEFGKFVAEDTAKWGKVIQAANIKLG